MSVPPILPASAWTAIEHGTLPSPIAILADAIDPMTRDWNDLFESRHPVDALVGEAFGIERDSGASVQGFGHRLRQIRYVDESTERELRDAGREALRDAERERLVEFVELTAAADADIGDLLLRYRNLVEDATTKKESPVRVSR